MQDFELVGVALLYDFFFYCSLPSLQIENTQRWQSSKHPDSHWQYLLLVSGLQDHCFQGTTLPLSH